MARKILRTALPPEGLQYVREFLSPGEQERFAAAARSLDFYDFVLLGVAAKRKVKHFGFSYEFYTPKVKEAEPFPDWLSELRDRVAEASQINPAFLDQALVAKYDPGAGIGWHRDAPAFGPTVVGISLESPAIMRFRREVPDGFEMYKQSVDAGSLYIIGGPSRSVWQHSLPPVYETRYSITFRTVRQAYQFLPGSEEAIAVRSAIITSGEY
jgi:alkylated DNA repair protein (DNA oxidative demethylase)